MVCSEVNFFSSRDLLCRELYVSDMFRRLALLSILLFFYVFNNNTCVYYRNFEFSVIFPDEKASGGVESKFSYIV